MYGAKLMVMVVLAASACTSNVSSPTAAPPATQATPIEGGGIEISSYNYADAGNYLLPLGETITLTWHLAPTDAARIAFLVYPGVYRVDITSADYVVIGEDTNPADGASIEWTVTGDVGGELLAVAYREDHSLQAHSLCCPHIDAGFAGPFINPTSVPGNG